MELLKQDHRYPKEAYLFVFEALDYAQNALQMGQDSASEPLPQGVQEISEEEVDENPQRHITGQDVCIAARQYAVRQYGALAKTVLSSLGINSTSDIGEIVYNMIRIGRMRKTTADRREDFNDVYDFEAAFQENYQIRQ
jgi:uncharacterized repeat protein (TIGR04138 family)